MTWKRNKYHNIKTYCDGYQFDSRKEAARYKELKLMEASGVIQDLKIQVPFEIECFGQLICKYYADFTYTEDGERIIEDSKGVRTRVFNLKWKLLKAQEGDKYKYLIT